MLVEETTRWLIYHLAWVVVSFSHIITWCICPMFLIAIVEYYISYHDRMKFKNFAFNKINKKNY
uniref:Uncharacterized protein n=1 Tax=Nelumbo nucifera TaxID=4432 RepID=A0A822Z0D9_NELNU|nr:TPA_asm: hypothetical protein HUJ06_007600 [Nelumbo nucifera]